MQYVGRTSKEGRRTLVEFPDCPGCQTFVEPGEDLATVAQEALEGWLEAELVYGDAPPPMPAWGKSARSGVLVHVDPALAVRLQLKRARHDRGMSQTDLARKVGVSRQQISLLESPDANLTINTLHKVVLALGMNLDIELREPAIA